MNLITEYNITPFNNDFGRDIKACLEYVAQEYWLKDIFLDLEQVLRYSDPVDFVRRDGNEIGIFVHSFIRVITHLEKYNLFTDNSFYFIKQRLFEVSKRIPNNVRWNGEDHLIHNKLSYCKLILIS